MTKRDDGFPRGDPADVAAYVDRVEGFPSESISPAFPPVEPVERPDPYGAFVTTFRVDGPVDGPLAGLEVAVKDNVAVRGVTVTAGTDALAWEPANDATAVERLRAAGARLVGTTNMDPFAFGTSSEWSAHGPTENPVAPGHTPGGSSSGSAAAVAGDLVDAALGTDTGGSVRIPASFCGIVGVKPTFGLVPRDGVVDLSPSNDHVGVLAGDVRTATRVLETIAGRDPTRLSTLPGPSRFAVSDLDDAPGELRVGVPEEFVAAASPQVAAEVEGVLADLGAEPGVRVEDVSVPEHEPSVQANDVATLMEFADLARRDGQPIGASRSADYRAAMRAVREAGLPVHERVRELTGIGAGLLDDAPEVYGRCWDVRRRLVHRTRSLFDEVDVLATPTTTMVAPETGEVGSEGGPSVVDTCRNTAPFNGTGQPAVSLPCGTAEDRPVGLQLVAPAGADEFLLRVARFVERTL